MGWVTLAGLGTNSWAFQLSASPRAFGFRATRLCVLMYTGLTVEPQGSEQCLGQVHFLLVITAKSAQP